MYDCLNIVSEKEGVPGAVLIRGLQLIEPEEKLLDGPGKIYRHLSLTKEHHNIDDLIHSDSFYLLEPFENKNLSFNPDIA